MKITFIVIQLLVLSFLLSYSGDEKAGSSTTKESNRVESAKPVSADTGFSYTKTLDYKINVLFDPVSKSINADEQIIWRNLTNESTDEIQFHLYPNAYKSDKTELGKYYHFTGDERTSLDIKSFKINNHNAELIYFQPEIANPYDSTVAKVKLEKPLQPGDSAVISFDYHLRIPKSVKRFGYASGRNFFFVAQWFPKVGVFQNGKWICSQYHSFTNYFSDFADYSVNITAPSNYTIGASADLVTKKNIEQGKTEYNFFFKGIHDFAWFAADNILTFTSDYTRKDSSKIKIVAYVQPERVKYRYRYINAVKHTLEYAENNLGRFPYNKITLVDVPRTCAVSGMEYPNFFTVGANLFSPHPTNQPESVTIHECTHSIFYGILANNEVYEAWLDEGFTSYFTEKVLHTFYNNGLVNFRFLSSIPIYGLNFLSYNEVPIIYTLENIHMPEGANALGGYYNNPTTGSIADTSYKLPDIQSYVTMSYRKPELMLLTLERYLGEKKMQAVLHDYYNTYKFKHPTADDFFAVLQRNAGEDMTWFINNFYRGSAVFDDRIRYIHKAGDNKYEIFAERLGDGFFKQDIAVITQSDTVFLKWDTPERWKKFIVDSPDEVIAAEIDPYRKNLLDMNFSNNSYTTEDRDWAALSLAARWFFWIQNALMFVGSIG